mgnify:CR=1 FL=1
MTAVERHEWRAKWQDMPDVAKGDRYRDALIPEDVWPLADRLGDRYEWDGDSQFRRDIERIRTARRPYPGIAKGDRYREVTRRVVYCDGTTRHSRYRLPVAGLTGRAIPGVASRERGTGTPSNNQESV